MYTQCPQCQAIFQITTEHLKAAGGDVRCGQCLTVFNALDKLSEELPAQPLGSPETAPHEEALADTESFANQTPSEHDLEIEAALEALDTIPLRDTDAAVDLSEFLAAEDAVETIGTLEPQTEPLPEDVVVETESILQQSETSAQTKAAATGPAEEEDRKTLHVPSVILDDLAREKAERLRPSSTPWAIGSIALMLIFLVQAIYFARDDLARDPKLRPWLETACAYAGCDISRPAETAKIEILGWDVRSHPVAAKALVASTTLINNARFAQPYPLLELRFSDINGTPLAQRRFKPREYLPAGTDFQAGMGPGIPVQVELELMDPGSAAVNFEFHAVTDPSTASQHS
jgi:predicted Zn finger-like uncharacterized protein